MKNKVIPVAKQEWERDELEQSASKIKAEYLHKQPEVKKGNVALEPTLRHRILALSLFPNPYNKQMVLKYATE